MLTAGPGMGMPQQPMPGAYGGMPQQGGYMPPQQGGYGGGYNM